MGRITATSIVCLIASCFADAIDAQTQTGEPLVSHDSVDPQSKVLDELRRLLVQQQKTLEEQGRQIARPSRSGSTSKA